MAMRVSRRWIICAAPLVVGAALVPLSARRADARAAEIYTGLLSSTGAGGFDVVAYVTDGKPVVGQRTISAEWKGANWRFATQANRAAFLADPATYAPAYGGHCAWAVAQNYRAKGDPRFWKIVEGRLFLNFDARVQAMWERDIPGFIAKADANWPAVLDR
jgi:hypothetical protein